jgi:acyl-CoA synthetase (AMP-forming)/AMP-acid ligase II
MLTMQHPSPSLGRERLSDISSVLEERAAQTPDNLSCCFLDSSGGESGRLTYRDLHERIRSYASGLAQRTAPGDRVILSLTDPADFIPLFMACLRVGRVPVPICPPTKRQSLTRTYRVLADSQAVLFVGDAESKEVLANEAAADRIEFVETRELQAEATSLRLRSSRVAFIQYTSGSTGSPKGAMITHGNIMANLAMIETAFHLNEQTRGCCWMPLYHDMGLIGHVLQALYSGFPLFLLQPLAFIQRPLVWLRTITRYRVSATGGPNFAFELCMRRIGPEAMADLDLSSWTTAYTGAEMINPQTLSRFGEKFAPCGFHPDAFLPCYGIAEATLLAASAPWGRGALTVTRPDAAGGGSTARYISVGTPGAGAQIIIRHATSRHPCARFEVGEVYVKGPHVMSGYWNDDAATQEALYLQEGALELKTGDLGYLSEEDHLVICGRLKEVLVLAGRKHIHGDLVASVSASHEAIDAAGVAVFSITDASHEDRAVLVCEIKRAFWTRLHEIRQVVVDSIRSAVQRDHGLLIRQVAFTRQNSLPRTTSGKLMVLETRRLFLERALGLE